MADREDRRVRYTKALLRDALAELMREHHISKISVTMLCDVADVHRSTFYTHYTSQYDLLSQIQLEVLDNIRRSIDEQGKGEAFPMTAKKLVAILEYGRKNSELIKVLLGDNSDGTFQRQIMELVNQVSYFSELQVDEPTREYISLFGLNGCISIIKKWLENGMRESDAMIAELIMRLTQYGNSAYLNHDAASPIF